MTRLHSSIKKGNNAKILHAHWGFRIAARVCAQPGNMGSGRHDGSDYGNPGRRESRQTLRRGIGLRRQSLASGAHAHRCTRSLCIPLTRAGYVRGKRGVERLPEHDTQRRHRTSRSASDPELVGDANDSDDRSYDVARSVRRAQAGPDRRRLFHQPRPGRGGRTVRRRRFAQPGLFSDRVRPGRQHPDGSTGLGAIGVRSRRQLHPTRLRVRRHPRPTGI